MCKAWVESKPRSHTILAKPPKLANKIWFHKRRLPRYEQIVMDLKGKLCIRLRQKEWLEYTSLLTRGLPRSKVECRYG